MKPEDRFSEIIIDLIRGQEEPPRESPPAGLPNATPTLQLLRSIIPTLRAQTQAIQQIASALSNFSPLRERVQNQDNDIEQLRDTLERIRLDKIILFEQISAIRINGGG